MSFSVEIRRQTVTYYGALGDWLGGDMVVLADHGVEVEAYDRWDAEDFGSPMAWAIDRIRRTDAREPSVSPVPDTLPEYAWLSGSYEEPGTGDVLETSARITGDFTAEQRAEIFRALVAR